MAVLTTIAVGLVAIAGGVILLVSTPAFALTADDIQAQVQNLMAQIQELTAQINQPRSQFQNGERDPGTGVGVMPSQAFKHRVCRLLARDLVQGARGDDVRGLQEFLREQKFLAVEPTGYFGQLTAQAVKKWQASEGVSAIGRFGPLSRERLMRWCGGGGFVNKERFSATPTRGDAPLAVTFYSYVSGFRPQSDYYTIEFGDGTSERASHCTAPADYCTGPGTNTHTYSSNGTYIATLQKTSVTCPVSRPGDPPIGAPCGQTTEMVGKVQINVSPIACTKEYQPVCGLKPIVCITTPCNPIPTTYSNKCEMEADGARLLYEGQCRTENPADDPQCKAWFDGCNSCSRDTWGSMVCSKKYCAPGTEQKPYCIAQFDTAGGKPPVISGFSGPTTLAEDATGTWTIRASDPENGALSYNVRWGDEFNPGPGVAASVEAAQWLQTTSFTHAYANPGTYTISITVRDNAGQTVQTSTTVRIGSAQPVACTAEAYQCPNGEWVGRTGPNCRFECPATSFCTFDEMAVGENSKASCVCSTCGTAAPTIWTCRNGSWKSTTGATYQSPMKSNYGYGTCVLHQ